LLNDTNDAIEGLIAAIDALKEVLEKSQSLVSYAHSEAVYVAF